MRTYVLMIGFMVLTVSTAQATNYGAVAFDQGSGAYGYSYNWASQRQADSVALSKCQGSCKIIGQYWNNCGSLSAAKDGSYGWDANMDEDVATRRALANCNKFAGGGCQIKVTVCNNAPQSPPSSPIETGAHFGRHGCWTRDWRPIAGCKN